MIGPVGGACEETIPAGAVLPTPVLIAYQWTSVLEKAPAISRPPAAGPGVPILAVITPVEVTIHDCEASLVCMTYRSAAKVPVWLLTFPVKPETREPAPTARLDQTGVPAETVSTCPALPEDAEMTFGISPVCGWSAKLIAPVVGEMSEIGFVRTFWNSLFQTAD